MTEKNGKPDERSTEPLKNAKILPLAKAGVPKTNREKTPGPSPNISLDPAEEPGLMVRNALQSAFEGMGGVKAMTRWAEANPKEFYQLYIKLLALQSRTDTGGDLIIQWQK